MAIRHGELRQPEMTLGQKIWQINWIMFLLIGLCVGVGLAMQYSAANGSWDPWAHSQLTKYLAFSVGMLVLALVDIRIIMRYAYLIYMLSFLLLVIVEIKGAVGGGATRWIAIPFIGTFQPSELMKFTLVLALARYFHKLSYEDVGRFSVLIVPALFIAAPTLLVLRQPDLGTAIVLCGGGVVMFLLAGVRWWKFAVVGIAGLAASPLIWSMMHPYQKRRVLVLLNPESDPLGSGYHILQSKIAMGAGGIVGRGFTKGSQSHLNFLPEKQTDFIFTMLAEEFGLIGCLALMSLYLVLMVYGFGIALRSRNQFGRLLAMGCIVTFSFYVFINIAMVMGVIPVVGLPLPLVSYGGSALLAVMFGFALIMNVYVHRDLRIGRQGESNGL
ncbi:rod shape-determining protein RodA [Hwanghaeella sp. 1Z406]|jgi:rod shape determining protein RodA|uniref:rod shape-determining protein RodA n=1 Tax=Hwanghaeella sp. 1Z406 TaxID=3402811 RepID=UPI0026CA8514|tara:strand:- start:39089 stop:40246 length:1158 start_codon:yes stop_codon:yes gene_type:complete